MVQVKFICLFILVFLFKFLQFNSNLHLLTEEMELVTLGKNSTEDSALFPPIIYPYRRLFWITFFLLFGDLQTLSASDLRDPEISALIAAKMREFHNLDMPGPKNVLLWDRVRYGYLLSKVKEYVK